MAQRIQLGKEIIIRQFCQIGYTIWWEHVLNKIKLYFFVYWTHLRVEVKETVVFKPQQQHLILLYILLHERPG